LFRCLLRCERDYQTDDAVDSSPVAGRTPHPRYYPFFRTVHRWAFACDSGSRYRRSAAFHRANTLYTVSPRSVPRYGLAAAWTTRYAPVTRCWRSAIFLLFACLQRRCGFAPAVAVTWLLGFCTTFVQRHHCWLVRFHAWTPAFVVWFHACRYHITVPRADAFLEHDAMRTRTYFCRSRRCFATPAGFLRCCLSSPRRTLPRLPLHVHRRALVLFTHAASFWLNCLLPLHTRRSPFGWCRARCHERFTAIPPLPRPVLRVFWRFVPDEHHLRCG